MCVISVSSCGVSICLCYASLSPLKEGGRKAEEKGKCFKHTQAWKRRRRKKKKNEELIIIIMHGGMRAARALRARALFLFRKTRHRSRARMARARIAIRARHHRHRYENGVAWRAGDGPLSRTPLYTHALRMSSILRARARQKGRHLCSGGALAYELSSISPHRINRYSSCHRAAGAGDPSITLSSSSANKRKQAKTTPQLAFSRRIFNHRMGCGGKKEGEQAKYGARLRQKIDVHQYSSSLSRAWRVARKKRKAISSSISQTKAFSQRARTIVFCAIIYVACWAHNIARLDRLPLYYKHRVRARARVRHLAHIS